MLIDSRIFGKTKSYTMKPRETWWSKKKKEKKKKKSKANEMK